MKEREIQSLEGRVVRKVPADKVTFQWEMVECESEKNGCLVCVGGASQQVGFKFSFFLFLS